MTRHCPYCGATDALVCQIDPAPRPGSVARYHAQARCLGCGLSGPWAGAMTPGAAQASAWLLWDGLPARLAQLASASGGAR